MTAYKITDTPTMILLAEDGAKGGYNRQLDTKWLHENADPSGTHLCVYAMMHEHIDGQLAEPHMRGQFLVKVRDTAEPVSVVFDLSMKNYRLMTEWEPPTEEKVTEDDKEKINRLMKEKGLAADETENGQ